MKILVTGGAGFIGSNVVDAYIADGHEVIIVDNLFSGKWENINPKARFYLLDIRSPEVRKVLEKERVDVINHHAAQMSVPNSVKNPDFDADVNVRGFLNLLEGAVATEVKKIIFISSGGAIYGEAGVRPTPEDCPVKPLSPYAITKTVSELYLAYYRHQFQLDYAVLRYANVYGPRQIPHGEAGVVSIFMSRLLARQPCTLFHFPDEPHGMTRDYCYVGDVVQANLLALGKGGGDCYNIGTGEEIHTATLYENIYHAVKERVPDLPVHLQVPERGAARDGDLTRSCLKIDKARTVLGFSPRYPLAAGLRQTLDWQMTQYGR